METLKDLIPLLFVALTWKCSEYSDFSSVLRCLDVNLLQI